MYENNYIKTKGLMSVVGMR